jgi:hypothetical protein
MPFLPEEAALPERGAQANRPAQRNAGHRTDRGVQNIRDAGGLVEHQQINALKRADGRLGARQRDHAGAVAQLQDSFRFLGRRDRPAEGAVALLDVAEQFARLALGARN